MPRTLRLAAVDLGASSGRVMVGTVGDGVLTVEEVHRFPNGPVEDGGALHWDIRRLHREMLDGLRKAGAVDGVGIDSWAVDYGLLDDSGALLGDPYCYRDARTDGVQERVFETVGERELYDLTGLQQLPFNTVYQLVASRDDLEDADTLLLVPDLLGYWLTGRPGAEHTNASTTQLYDVRGRVWAQDLLDRLGLPSRLFPALREPGDVVGPLLPEVAGEVGLPERTPVIAVGSHDTASAVVAVPAAPDTPFAYISSGTWSLVGVELSEPVLTEDARLANFTNEGGVDGTIRFLRNVTGLWVLSEAMRQWAEDGDPQELSALLAEAAEVSPFAAVVDIDDPVFLPPGDMAARVAEQCLATGQPVPSTPAGLTRCILESLALAYRRTVRRAGELTGSPAEVVHVVGGGALNELLCQLTADACGVPVLAGPVEAAALGNVLVQARTLGADLPDLAAMRRLVRDTHELRRYQPSGETADWEAAEARLSASTAVQR